MNIVNTGYPGEQSYHELCREERAFAAVLYAALCRPANLRAFVRLCRVDLADAAPEPAPYFEYAHLRDWWFNAGTEKRLAWLLPQLPDELRATIHGLCKRDPYDIWQINDHLGVVGNISRTELQMPGRWGIARIAASTDESAAIDFRQLCMLKWSFNIKPDLLVELDHGRVICVEAKVCSGQGRYPVAGSEREIFRRRNQSPVMQMELQRHMLEKLLGKRVAMVSLSSSGTACGEIAVPLSWRAVFAELDTAGMPENAIKLIERVSAA